MTTERLTAKEFWNSQVPTDENKTYVSDFWAAKFDHADMFRFAEAFAAQEVAAIENKYLAELSEAYDINKARMPTEEEINTYFYYYSDCVTKNRISHKIPAMTRSAIIKFVEWFSSRIEGKDASIIATAICPDCMAYNKKTDEELIKCWNCGNPFRSRMKGEGK